jgi:energy-coupling factor transporter ATP-binding protein EcfA2
VYGNRNLIDEDLFVDLALVKPTRSQNTNDPQEIDPERGSDVFTPPEETIEKRFAYQEFLQEVIDKRTDTEKKKIAIIGEPGAGKTTLLQKLAFWLLQETNDLVIWVSLAELGSQSLREYLEEKWLKLAFGQSKEEIQADWEQKFKRGAVWLLLDGLDEMSQSHQQALKFGALVIDAQMIVTCRLNLWQANPSQFQGFQTYLTQPFQDEQMQEFIQRWFPGLFEAVEADQLAESLESELQAEGKERIKDLCRNPLRLTLLCATWQGKKGALPDTTAKLYKKFVNYIYEWNKKEFTVTPEESKRLNAVLGELAKASLDREGTKFCLNHQLVCEYLGQPDDNSLLDMALNLGWLNKVGNADEPEDLVYVFYHATFQEYFAALAVENWNYFLPRTHVNRPVEGKYRIFEPQWKQVILLWLGREDVKHEEKEGFIRALVGFKSGVRDFYYYQAYFLAAAGINEFKACSISLSVEIVRQLVKWAFGYFNLEKQQWINFLEPIKERSKQAISNTIRRLAITEMIEVISICPNKKERLEVAYILGEISRGNEKVIIALTEILANSIKQSIQMIEAEKKTDPDFEKHSPIRFLIYWIKKASQYLKKYNNSIDDIKNIPEQEILKLIINTNLPEVIQKKTKKTTLKIEIIQQKYRQKFCSITKIKSKDLIDIILLLRECLKDNSSPYLADYKVEDIIYARDLVIAKLIQLIKYSNDEYIEFLGILILIRLCRRKQNIIQALIELMTTVENENTRWWIAENLEEMDPGNFDVIAGLLEVIRTTEDEDTRKRAAWSLPKILTTPEHYAWVVSALKDCLSDEVYQNNFKRFHECYKVIWNCAENLPYPLFYEAWHNPLPTPPSRSHRTNTIGS